MKTELSPIKPKFPHSKLESKQMLVSLQFTMGTVEATVLIT